MPLKPWEVKVLGLGRPDIDDYVDKVPEPGFGPGAQGRFMNSMADAALAAVMGLSFDAFVEGLDRARTYNASVMMPTAIGEIAVSALMSKLKSPNVERKTVVVPAARVELAESMSIPHAVVAGFVQESDLGREGSVPVSVAGWVWVEEVRRKALSRKPFRFKSKIPVHLVPCSELRPIDDLLKLRETGNAGTID